MPCIYRLPVTIMAEAVTDGRLMLDMDDVCENGIKMVDCWLFIGSQDAVCSIYNTRLVWPVCLCGLARLYLYISAIIRCQVFGQ